MIDLMWVSTANFTRALLSLTVHGAAIVDGAQEERLGAARWSGWVSEQFKPKLEPYTLYLIFSQHGKFPTNKYNLSTNMCNFVLHMNFVTHTLEHIYEVHMLAPVITGEHEEADQMIKIKGRYWWFQKFEQHTFSHQNDWNQRLLLLVASLPFLQINPALYWNWYHHLR